MEREKRKKLIILLLCMIPLSLCFGGDERSRPAEVYLMLDNSISIQGSEQKAAAWISEHIADNVLQSGDSFTIWSASDAPVLEYSGTISGPESIDEIKAVLSAITPKNSEGNYRAAIEEIRKKNIPHSEFAHAYIILVTGISGNTASLFSAETQDVLKYSRSMDFPGWKVMIIGMGIEQKVKVAAAAYMSSQK
jgi:hypothetical protein